MAKVPLSSSFEQRETERPRFLPKATQQKGYCGKALQRGGGTPLCRQSGCHLWSASEDTSSCEHVHSARTHTHKPQPHTSWLPRARALHFRGLQVTQLKQVARGNNVKFAPQSWIPNLLELGGVSGVGCLAQLPIWTGLPCKYPFTDLLRPSVCLHSSMDGALTPRSWLSRA